MYQKHAEYFEKTLKDTKQQNQTKQPEDFLSYQNSQDQGKFLLSFAFGYFFVCELCALHELHWSYCSDLEQLLRPCGCDMT